MKLYDTPLAPNPRRVRWFMAESAWIAADRLTTADIIALVGLDFGRMIKFRLPGELTHVAPWTEAMRARPAAAAGMPRKASAA